MNSSRLDMKCKSRLVDRCRRFLEDKVVLDQYMLDLYVIITILPLAGGASQETSIATMDPPVNAGDAFNTKFSQICPSTSMTTRFSLYIFGVPRFAPIMQPIRKQTDQVKLKLLFDIPLNYHQIYLIHLKIHILN